MHSKCSLIQTERKVMSPIWVGRPKPRPLPNGPIRTEGSLPGHCGWNTNRHAPVHLQSDFFPATEHISWRHQIRWAFFHCGRAMPYHKRLVVGFPGQVLWDFWWTKWQCYRLSTSMSVSPANAHSTVCSTFTNHSTADTIHRGYFYCVDLVHGSALHGGLCAACREKHTIFSNESACLTASNFRKEVVNN